MSDFLLILSSFFTVCQIRANKMLLVSGLGNKTVKFNDGCIKDLDWWANGGLLANRVSTWRDKNL